ncbi:MAG TPA: WYL domain-containing protein [Symbiobacteriaceae bacterium]|jgi:predicted DNA-binding transcriptional regulator YafY|nr:WYL domain-containing protein [Symbiobacteriaceae bacterium]
MRADRLLSILLLLQVHRRKLQAALPPMMRRDAEYIRQRIHVDTAGWRGPGQRSDLLPAVQHAIFQQRRLAMTYLRSGGTETDRSVAPLGLVAKGSTWYLVAAVEGELRT